MSVFLAFWFGGGVATFALQVLDTDGRFWRPLVQGLLWPVFLILTFAHELGWLKPDDVERTTP